MMKVGLFLAVAVSLAAAAAAAAKEPKVFDPKTHMDWGTYYDPQSIFCGNYDCYKILGFDFENYGSPDRKEITQRYRALGREWHPDKSKHKNAKERFVVRFPFVMPFPPTEATGRDLFVVMMHRTLTLPPCTCINIHPFIHVYLSLTVC
jgi:DnaJ domain